MVWDIVPIPKGKSGVLSKWLFKIKHVANGSIEKYKVLFVARGFSQKEGIDYEETFALVARYTSVKAVIAIATSKWWKIHQMDVKIAFLNDTIEEELYLEKPEGFVIHNVESCVCRLKKAYMDSNKPPELGMKGLTTILWD